MVTLLLILVFTLLFPNITSAASPGINLINQPGNTNIVSDSSLKNWIFYAPPSPDNIANISASNVVLRIHSHWESSISSKMLGSPNEQQEIANQWCNSIKAFSSGKTVYVEPFNELEHDRERLNLPVNEAITRAQRFIGYLQSCPGKNFTVISPSLDPHHPNFPQTKAAFGNFDIISYHAYGPAKAREYSSLFPGKRFIFTEVGVLANGDSGLAVYDDCKFIQFFCDQNITQHWQNDNKIIAYFMFTVEPDSGSWRFSHPNVAKALKAQCNGLTCTTTTCNLNSTGILPPILLNQDIQAPPPGGNIYHPEAKHPDYVPNRIQEDPNVVVCHQEIVVEETKTPNSIFDTVLDTLKFIPTYVENIKRNFQDDSRYTNKSTRKIQQHWAGDFPADTINASKEELRGSFLSYSYNGTGVSLKTTSVATQNKLKDQRLQQAVDQALSKNTTTLNEQVAWACDGECYSVNCEKPFPNCRPVMLDEVAYALQKTSEPQINSKYQAIPLLPSSCYQKIYQLLNIVDTGSYDTLRIVKDDSGMTKSSNQAIPMGAVFTNNPAQQILPYQSDYIPGNICETENKPEQIDKPNSVSFFEIVKRIAREITDVTNFRETVSAETILPKNLETGVRNTETSLTYILPEKAASKVKSEKMSSTNGDRIDPGHRSEVASDLVSLSLTPKTWHSSLGELDNYQKPYMGDNPYSDINPPGEGVSRWCDLINRYARDPNDSSQLRIDPSIIAALITIESNGNPEAISHQGAVGLMQIMPRDNTKGYNFMCKNGPCFADRPTTAELLNPEFNVEYGINMLIGLIKYHGSLEKGLTHYGPAGYCCYASRIFSIRNSNPDFCHASP